MKKIDKTNHFLGFKIVSTSKDQVLKNLFSQVENSKSDSKTKIVFTPNPEQLVLATTHSSYGKYLGKADYLLPDGMGIIIGSRILSLLGKTQPILERITGVDVVSELLQKFPSKKILILGGRDYLELEYHGWKVAQLTNPGLYTKIATANSSKKQNKLYWLEGFLNVTQPTVSEQKIISEQIDKLKPDIVFVALGAPHQEQWVIENYEVLQMAGVKLVMVVGGAFDVLLGKVTRAPKWMQKVGLEWFFRLTQEPWRWKRQLNLLVFIKMVVQEALS